MTSDKPLLDKLGIKADSKVSVLGVEDESVWQQLRERTPHASAGRPRKASDFIFLAARKKEDLNKLRSLRASIKSNGAIWVVWPKGRQEINQTEVMAASKEAGLVDVKVVSFSATHTALKLVIPVARRA